MNQDNKKTYNISVSEKESNAETDQRPVSVGIYRFLDIGGLKRGISIGVGFVLTLGASALLAVAVTGTVNTFVNGSVMEASQLNTNFSSLKTAIEGITSSQWTSNGSSIYYNGGNVGIGTTSPSNKLEISGGGITLPYSTDNSSSIKFIASGGGPWNVLGIKDTGNVYLRTIDNGVNSGIIFQDSAGTDRVKIQNDGKVGIGTTSPASALHVNGFIHTDFYGLGTNSATLILRKARGTSSSPAAVQSGDGLSYITTSAYDGTGFFNSTVTTQRILERMGSQGKH